MSNNRVLISTIAPYSGGVPQMTRFIVGCLKEKNFVPVLAYYQPYSLSPKLSVPSFKLLQRRVSKTQCSEINGCEAHGFGAWLPELEFTHYMPTKLWQEMMCSCVAHIAISGNCLAALPYVLTGRKFLSWVATPWHEDRKDRVKDFPLLRKQLDKIINARVITRLEKRILSQGNILALSDYTKKKLQTVVGNKREYAVLPMPINLELFKPDSTQVVAGRIGFSGRFCDPRKNITLLLEAIKICRTSGFDVTLELIGDQADEALQTQIDALGLQSSVECIAQLDHAQLAQRLRCLDMFVIPSYQEGLCIAALEAMASACPVISTACGGPEEYVINGVTGQVVDFDAKAMAAVIMQWLQDRTLRQALAARARDYTEQHYSQHSAKQVFWQNFNTTFNPLLANDIAVGNG